MPNIKESFDEHIRIDITHDLIRAINTLVLRFELREEHPLTLNSTMFGVHKFVFKTDDRNMFFDVIGISEKDVNSVVTRIPSIDKAFLVISDAFNLMCVYLVHRILLSHISKHEIEECCTNVLNFMQYRFMSSAINHYFPHKANYEIMQTVTETLNLKFAIKQYGTWKKVMSARSLSILATDKLHGDTLRKFDKDKDILYMITDMSTRIRSQLKIVTTEYYTVKDTNKFIGSHSATTELDGEKILKERDGHFALMTSVIYNKILNKSAFIDDHIISMVQTSVSRLNTSIIKRTLITLSDEARHQQETNETDKIIHKRDGTEIFIGVEVLVGKILNFVYMSAILSNRVNLNSKIAVYSNAKNIFAASRTSDKRMIDLRLSIADFLKRTRISSRESTVSGLVVAIVLYITLLSFQFN